MQLTGRICAIVGTVFLAFALNYIDRLPNPDGFTLILTIPLYGVWILFCLPALVLSATKKLSMASTCLGIIAVATYALLVTDYLTDFSGHLI